MSKSESSILVTLAIFTAIVVTIFLAVLFIFSGKSTFNLNGKTIDEQKSIPTFYLNGKSIDRPATLLAFDDFITVDMINAMTSISDSERLATYVTLNICNVANSNLKDGFYTTKDQDYYTYVCMDYFNLWVNNPPAKIKGQ